MIAGYDSCYCSTCGAICTGKFAACQGVWDRGPQPVRLRRKGLRAPEAAAPKHDGGNYNGPATNGTDGNGAHHEHSLTTPRTGPGIDPAALQAVFDEIKLLRRQIEQANPPRSVSAPSPGAAVDTGAYLARINSLLESLPERIADAVSDALARQHQLIMKDVTAALQDQATRLAALARRPMT